MSYKKLNLLIGWLVFAVAAAVYFLTLEPTASWWDCGEYIATAYKLQVGHPPGAPFFQILGRFFSLFAFGDTSKVALMINAMSALSSALTIMFMFWTITALARKFFPAQSALSTGNALAILGSGLVGALAYTFSDSFWFSAVEGEVYAMSSLFTALTFWAILKWEQIADEPHADRYILLIVFLIGISIGVHLLNLLAIPTVVLVYYYKKYEPTLKGTILTLLASLLLIGFILYGVIPEIVKLFANTEILFVNTLGLPFSSGTVFFALTLLLTIILGVLYTIRDDNNRRLRVALLVLLSVLGLLILLDASGFGNFVFRLVILGGISYGIYLLKAKKPLLNAVLMSFVFLLIGYSTFLIIIIRSNADTPIDENSPEDAVSLLAYLNREQYGDTPLFTGPYYNSPIIDYGDRPPVYEKDKEKGKYVITDDRKGVVPIYHPDFTTIFPRMWSSQKKQHIQAYKNWGNVTGRPVEYRDPNSGETKVIQKPTFGENLTFFFRYQIGHMYVRYFMWNFAGRQNDIEGHGGIKNGNWKSGIPFIDARLGNQNNLPDSMKNAADNKYYMLPFLFGLIGLFYQIQRKPKDALVVGVLFVMTGLAIVVYLNQYPYQPRERDYAYAGSFYAYAIWIGLSVIFFFRGLSKVIKNKAVSAMVVTVVALALVPAIMASEGWDDHDRSGKYAARDFAANYLNSCQEDAILITNGDNDTFPLWYAQEVEEIRTDVRVVNYMLASGDWYIKQLYNKVYESEPLPFTLEKDQYTKGTNDVVLIADRGLKGHWELKKLIDFVKSDNDATKLRMQDGRSMNYLPTRQVKITVDKDKVVESGIVPAYMKDQIVDEVKWTIHQNYLYKNDLMFLDFLASNNWERALYFANPSSSRQVFDADQYMHLEGMVYKFIPVKADGYIKGMGGVNARKSYGLLTEKFKWGNLNKPGVLVDRESMRNTLLPKNNYIRVAEQLLEDGEPEKAVAVADACLKYFPNEKIPFDFYMIPLLKVYYEAGATDKGNNLLQEMADRYNQDIDYYASLKPEVFAAYQEEMSQAYSAVRRLIMIAEDYGQDELIEGWEDDLESRLSMFGNM